MVTFGLHELHEDLMMRMLEEMGRVLKGSVRLYIIDYENEKGFFKIRRPKPEST
jgi:ubiquinone/menaquinone biosynthesis C-methylase UbiE